MSGDWVMMVKRLGFLWMEWLRDWAFGGSGDGKRYQEIKGGDKGNKNANKRCRTNIKREQ